MHYFSYKIGLLFAFFDLECTETFLSFFKEFLFSEGWTVLTETSVSNGRKDCSRLLGWIKSVIF